MLGLALLAKFLNELAGDIERDVRNFPPVWRSSPTLAILLALFVLCAYVFGVWLIGFMIYVPVRNLFCPRIIEGTLKTVSATFTDKGKPVLSIKLNQHEFLVPNLGDLDKVVTNPDLQWQKLRFSLGAFNRVLRVDKLS